MDRKARSDLHQRRSRIARRSGSTEAVEFFNVLTSAELLETTEALLPEHRERLYPPTVTLSMFMRQTLEADASCQKAVNGWAAQRAADGLRACSVRTGGYCRARQRLPLEMVSALARHTGCLLSQKAHTRWLWRGRAVKLVDGTGLSMPDTPENQAVYPQPSTQATGVGFPLARLVMVICLATGAALDAAIGPHQGKGSGELGLVRQVLGSLRPGDVMLADALYCNYFLIATLMAAGVDVLFEQNGSRITDFRRGQSLGTRDHIVRWPKPVSRPQWMTHDQYANAPNEIVLRECKVGHQVLVTTLLDHRRVSKDDVSQLYARRWNVELDFAQSEDHHRHGRSALPDATDERQAVVGASAGLQRDPSADGTGRQQRQPGSAQPELQAHGATVDAVGGVRAVCYVRQWTAVRADRAMPSGSSTRAHRASNAKTKTQTLSLAQDAKGSRTQAGSATRACVGDKVSAIRFKPTFQQPLKADLERSP